MNINNQVTLTNVSIASTRVHHLRLNIQIRIIIYVINSNNILFHIFNNLACIYIHVMPILIQSVILL